MAEPSRGLQISRRGWLMAGLFAPLFPARAADSLIVTFDGDNLHISSLGVHFLQGKSLNRLKDGSTVEYVATVGLFRDQFASQFKRTESHFFVSYDVLGTGDVFAVSTPGPPLRRATNLSLSAAETWCFERIGVATTGLARDQQFWLQLELRTVPPKLDSILGPRGIHVDLLDVLIPGSDEKQIFRWGPKRLEDFVVTRQRGRAG
ncbi:MAG TPA: hypothetical protein VMB03_19230 [Bryobacteraceae bacterium]|nr:hypothetical protein [Bryobacteraceae bacterium]